MRRGWREEKRERVTEEERENSQCHAVKLRIKKQSDDRGVQTEWEKQRQGWDVEGVKTFDSQPERYWVRSRMSEA